MRKRVITRSIVLSHVTAFTFDKANKKMEEKLYTIIGDYETKDIETLLREEVKADGLALVEYSVSSQETVIRSMSEADFYANSVTITRGAKEE